MKIAVYSCITGRYDIYRDPLITEKVCDYFMISDEVGKSYVYQWIDVDSVVPRIDMPLKDKNRYCKMHPHELFPGYDYSIYIDGSVQIVRPIAHYISRIGKTGLGMHIHRKSDDIYSEGIFLSWLGVVDNKEIIRDMKKYLMLGIPRHFGMLECGVIVTDLHNLSAKEIYDCWYQEYLNSSKRDQQSLIYALWSLGFAATDIGNIGGDYNVFTNPDLHWHRNSHYKSG